MDQLEKIAAEDRAEHARTDAPERDMGYIVGTKEENSILLFDLAAWILENLR